LLAIVLSLLRHVRHSYRPHTAVLVERDGRWLPIPAVAGAVSAPGVVVFQFGADLFYANASRFAEEIRVLVGTADAAIVWLIVDAGAITSVDFSAARVWLNLLKELRGRATTLILVHAEAPLLADLQRHRLIDEIGANNVFDTASGSERARINYYPRDQDSLRKDSRTQPALATLLASSIRTGTFCSYTPDSRLPGSWQL
jgi:MFS superfamily sulfate permease-like transporter